MLGSKRMTHPFCNRLAHPDNPNNLQKQFVGHLLQEAYPCKLSGSFANKLSYTEQQEARAHLDHLNLVAE